MLKTLQCKLSVVVVVLLSPCVLFAGVTVSSPAPGSTQGSPVHFVVSASASRTITAINIYVDSVKAFHATSSKIDTMLSMSTGTHKVVITAWDSSGATYNSSFSLSISGTTVSTTFSATTTSIQKMTGWSSCTVCAGINAKGPVATYSMTQNQASPSLSGHSTRFSISGPTPYADVLWWKQLPGSSTATHFQYDVDFYLKTPQYAEALEFDMNQNVGGHRYIFGTQCAAKTSHHSWDVWDTANGRWVSTGVPCPTPTAFKWHHLTWEYYRSGTQTHFVAFTIDGVRHYVNMTFNAKPWSNVNTLSVAFQMDGDYAMHAYSTWIDNLTLRYR